MSFNTSMDFIVTDAEYQTFGDTRETGWIEPHHHKEIFQIWAAKVISGEVIERINIFVKPRINRILTPQSIDLTGVSQDTIDQQGVSYEQWLADFVSFS